MDDMCMTGRTGTQDAALFLGMWAGMMIPMMLPSLVPSLRNYRSTAGAAIAGAGYFAVWTVVGLAAYPVHAALSGIAMRVPLVAGMAVAIAGALQFTAWKARRLACCRVARAPDGAWGGWRYGVRVGVDCVARCANLMAVLLVTGAMELAPMILVTLAITAERYVPRTARPIGAILVATGLAMIAHTT